MKILTRAFCMLSAVAVAFSMSLNCFADGEGEASYTVSAKVSDYVTEGISAVSAVVFETETGEFLSELNSEEKRNVSHLAKLMTLLIAAEKISLGELSADETATASAYANSMGSPQIWLDVGEDISVDELIKSITVGNANDACITLAEKISGSEEEFVAEMNRKAKNLGMNSTHFSDSTGISLDTVSTAHDIALLASQLLKYDFLSEYFLTELDYVRDGSVQLVSTNRMLRTYNGVTGLKACSSAEAGECLAVSAKRGEMSLCAVLLGCTDDDSKFSDAKTVLDRAFEKYEIYTPEIPQEALEKIKVANGEKQSARVETAGLTPTVIEKGGYSSVVCEFQREDKVNAPLKKDEKIGEIVFLIDGETILSGEIVSKETVKKIKFGFAVKKLLTNLMNI